MAGEERSVGPFARHLPGGVLDAVLAEVELEIARIVRPRAAGAVEAAIGMVHAQERRGLLDRLAALEKDRRDASRGTPAGDRMAIGLLLEGCLGLRPEPACGLVGRRRIGRMRHEGLRGRGEDTGRNRMRSPARGVDRSGVRRGNMWPFPIGVSSDRRRDDRQAKRAWGPSRAWSVDFGHGHAARSLSASGRTHASHGAFGAMAPSVPLVGGTASGLAFSRRAARPRRRPRRARRARAMGARAARGRGREGVRGLSPACAW